MVNERKDYISIATLSMANLLNYVDRYTIAGILTRVQSFYHINDSMAGLIQTVFIGFYLFASPLCGYLGDRFKRKLVIVIGMALWLTAVLCSSFVPAQVDFMKISWQQTRLKKEFWIFLLFRGLLGIGIASFSSVSPPMISDMFSGELRTHMYMLFYFAMPVGSGLGFVVGTNFTSLLGSWQWGIRVTTIVGLIVLMMLVMFVDEPERGAAEKTMGGHLQQQVVSSYWQDMKALASTPTFISCTFAYTALIFVTGTLSWWGPTIIKHSIAWDLGLKDTRLLPNSQKNQVGMLFGAITTVSGLIGVAIGTFLTKMLRHGRGIFRPLKTERAQPIISGIGGLFAAPLLLVIFIFGHKSIVTLWISLFFAVIFLSFNWSLNVDILMSVIIPSRRSTAFSHFVMISRLFGEAPAPYIIGAVSDAIRGPVKTPETQYTSLVKCCLVTTVLLCISTVLYMVCAAVLLRDQMKFRRKMGMITTCLEKPTSTRASSEEQKRTTEETRNEFKDNGVQCI